MYVGRIVGIGRNRKGRACIVYRVSSRSYPNREAKHCEGSVAILPKEGFEDVIDKNPFIAYNCLRIIGNYIIAGNGSHTDILTAKLQNNYTMRDALITVLHTFDYEGDSLSTPRIAAVLEKNKGYGYLGVITKASLHVQKVNLTDGKLYYIATYEHNYPSENYSDDGFDAQNAEETCHYVLHEGIFANLEKPVTAACAMETQSGSFRIAVGNSE